MFDTIGGLPVHPLVVHAVVVLGPLAALCLVLYAAVPKWRIGLRFPTLLLALIAAASAFTATESGEQLENRVGDPAYDHAEAGDLAAVSMYVLLVAALIVIFFLARAAAEKSMTAVALVVAVAAAGFALFAVVNAGHSGASAVWKDQISSSSPGSGD